MLTALPPPPLRRADEDDKAAGGRSAKLQQLLAEQAALLQKSEGGREAYAALVDETARVQAARRERLHALLATKIDTPRAAAQPLFPNSPVRAAAVADRSAFE